MLLLMCQTVGKRVKKKEIQKRSSSGPAFLTLATLIVSQHNAITTPYAKYGNDSLPSLYTEKIRTLIPMKNLLIRAEDKNRWERRTPIVPKDLSKIISTTGAKTFVEKSEKRFFSEAAYSKAGALSCTDMGVGDVILGVKEIPVEKILPNKTYLFFSHTIKGQKENMGLLQKIIDSGSTLIDYEKITDPKGRRLIYFGPFAGDAGAIDILSLMGEHWSEKGIKTPLSTIKRAHEYDSVEAAQKHLRKMGAILRKEGFPEELSPFTVGVLGYGNVSTGAQRILDCLPTERVTPDSLKALVDGNNADRRTVYITVFTEKDLVRTISVEESFDLQTYYDHPERYESKFEPFLPYFTLLINAVYWEARYPKFVTWEGLKRIFETSRKVKLSGIADISCDTNGAVECNVKSTDSDMPAYRVDPATGTVSDGHIGDGIVLLAVDNLPCELPNDSSTFFSNQLRPFIPGLLRADYESDLETSGLPNEIKKAVIVYNGKMTPAYEYLNAYLRE
jgi:alpha-aminoadipic semialdehyde synthase